MAETTQSARSGARATGDQRACDAEPSHTPGPWATNPVNAQVDAFDTGAPVAVCRLLWPTKKRSEAETEANARLIASAPEMLMALRELVASCEDQDLGNIPEFSRRALNEARIVIAQALGGKSDTAVR